jgi:hypothetical protein
MARDNSPKARQQRDLQRKQGRRASHDRILIITEGSKTEPLYFQEIRAHYRLNTASVEVRPSVHGTTPIQVVEYARELFLDGNRHNRVQPRAFEQVYAVFDRDEHPSYAEAVRRAAALDGTLKNDAGQRVSFHAIASVPSFELWLLLHFENIQAPIHRDDVLRRLRSHLPHYEKGAGQVFAATRERLATALQHAQALSQRNNALTDPKPFTAVGGLVSTLVGLSG